MDDQRFSSVKFRIDNIDTTINCVDKINITTEYGEFHITLVKDRIQIMSLGSIELFVSPRASNVIEVW